MIKKYEIDINQYKAVKKIKSGGFGSVYIVQNDKTNEKYAAKVIASVDNQIQKYINREINIMIRLKHPTIIKFYGYSLKDFSGNDNITILMQLATKGSLAELLSKVKKCLGDHNYDNTARQKILIGIARGMKYLHQNHIIHRDLKPENILLDDELEPYITDFGLSKIISTEERNNTASLGTCSYMAPEIIEGKQYNGKVDVYSFGILMYQVVTDLTLYPELHKNKMHIFKFHQKVVEENYRPEFSVPVKPKIRELIEKCWSADPKDRPTFDEIYNRLSRNIEESVYSVFDGGENEAEYYLDDVNIDEILSYVNKIEDEENSPTIDLNRLLQKMNQIEAENTQLKEKIKDLEDQLNSKVDHIQQQLNTLQKVDQPNNNSNNFPDEYHIHVIMNKAKNLRKMPDGENTNPFARVNLKSYHASTVQQTSVALDMCDPEWGNELDFYTTDINDILLIDVYQYDEKNRREGEKLIDQIEYPLNKLTFDGKVLAKVISMTYNKTDAGKIYFSISANKVPQPEIEPICTFSITDANYMKQTYYSCMTCNLNMKDGLGMCEACARRCHKGHNVKIEGFMQCYCDCPQNCKCNSMPKKSDLECTSVKTKGKPTNQLMYHCISCDKTDGLFICQNCAARDHFGHDLVFLGIVEGKVCQNEEIDV